MWLANTSIKRPVFATMMVMALVILGVVSYTRLGMDLFPKVDFPMVNITTTLKGANPEIMDIDVTDRVEETVNTINGVKTIMSTSAEGVSSVMVEFVLEKDIDLAVQDVREKISAIRQKLPRDIDEPVIEKVDPDANPVLWIALAGQKPVRDLSTYADEVLKEQLQKINGVGALRLAGLRLRQVRVWLDADRLDAYGITAHDVMRALSRENIELPAGRLESETKEYSVKIKGEFTSPEEFNGLIVGYRNGAPIRLSDIGAAEDGMAERRSIARFNGMPAIGIGVQKQSGTNTVEVIENVKRELPAIIKTLPPGMDLRISFDQSDFIKRSINEVQHHLIYGGIFASLAVLLFLKNIRVTLISALAIPISIISTFSIMDLFGFTFNNMTMLALSLCIGILIDDAIIVIENIYRHMEGGMKPMEAASFATQEIGLAVTATTLAIAVIFLPVAFMKGIIGRFFMQFALTVVFAVLVSLFISFTLTPMLASRFLRLENHKDNPSRFRPVRKFSGWTETAYKWTEGVYRNILGHALDHKFLVVMLAIGSFAASLYITKFIGKEFAPQEDQSRFLVRLQAPVDYSVDEVDRLFMQAEKIVRDTPEVETVFYAQGFGLTRETNKGAMFIALAAKADRKRAQQEIMAEIRKKLRTVPGLKGTAEDISLIGGGLRNVPIQFSVRGPDLSRLEEYTREIASRFGKVPGVVDLDTSLETGKAEFRVRIDRDKAASLGVDMQTLAETVNFLVGGETDITKFKDETRGRRYDVRARLLQDYRTDPSDLGRLYVRSSEGRLVDLANIISIDEGGGPSIINRVDRQRAITLFSNLEGKPLGEAKADLDGIAAEVLPPDYTGGYKGMADIMGESFKYLGFAIFLGIVMAYMVLASQFDSFMHPFTILMSMPLAFIGAFAALFLTGKTMNIFSFIGIILLMGLVKKNAILLVDYTNTLRARGMERKEAILEAGPVRLRPILMTTFAMIFGMMPIAIGIGEGAETRAPMAIAVVGGLITSLFLTLVVVPVVYILLDDLQAKLRFPKRLSLKKKGEAKSASQQ